jgi:hypothetical protein
VDHTLRLIQYNWVVLAYNFNVVILVLIIEESCIGAFLLIHFISVLSLLLPCIISLFLHLLSTNYKCTQPCCLEGEDGLEIFDEEFLATCCPGCHSCGVMKSSIVPFH